MTMKISEVMTTEVETIGSDQTAREAASFMLRADAGSIPVCDGDKVIGMITDRDIAVRGVAEGRGPDTPVSELMSDGIICAREDEDIPADERRAGPPTAGARCRGQALRDCKPWRPHARNARRSSSDGAGGRQLSGRITPTIDERRPGILRRQFT